MRIERPGNGGLPIGATQVTYTRIKKKGTSEMKPKVENTETGSNVVENTECYLFCINSEIDTSSAPDLQYK